MNSQTISFNTNKTSLYKNEFLSISITFSKDAKKEFIAYKAYQFPDIPDMQKSHTYFNDKEGNEKAFSITQWYEPIKAGPKQIPEITVQTRHKSFTNAAFTVSVLSEETDHPAQPPAESWIAKTRLQNEFPSLEWKVRSDVRDAYPLEPIHISGYLLIPDNNTQAFTYADTHIQQQNLLKRFKPANCMVHDQLKTEQLVKDSVTIDHQLFIRVKIIDLYLFPLKPGVITIPASEWYVYGYKTGTSNEGVVRVSEKCTFKSAGFQLRVKELPPHPLQDVVPVGSFVLSDYLEQKKIQNGNATFLTVVLEGNTDLSSIGDLEFFSKNMELISSETVSLDVLAGDHWKVRKVLKYQINPLRGGDYKMKDAFRYMYFNPKKNAYDTIYPSSVLTVYGERISESNAMLTNDDFYNRYNSQASSNIIDGSKDEMFNRLANLIILIMLVVTAILVIRK